MGPTFFEAGAAPTSPIPARKAVDEGRMTVRPILRVTPARFRPMGSAARFGRAMRTAGPGADREVFRMGNTPGILGAVGLEAWGLAPVTSFSQASWRPHSILKLLEVTTSQFGRATGPC